MSEIMTVIENLELEVEDFLKFDIQRNGKLFTTGFKKIDTAKKLTVEGILEDVKLKKYFLYYFSPLTWFYYDLYITLTNQNNNKIELIDFPAGIFYPGKLKRKLKKYIGKSIKINIEFNPDKGTFIVKENYFKGKF